MYQMTLPIVPTTGIPWTAHEYQKAMTRWLVSHPEAALFADPGLGKSSCALAAFKALKHAGGSHKALIIAPLRVAENVWSNIGELGKWEDFAGLSVSHLLGTRKERDAAFKRDADIYVLNFDGIPWLVEQNKIFELIRRGVDLLIIDELSKFKHPRTKRFKLIKPFLSAFKRRWGLTGSPTANGLLDLFGQIFVLDLGKRLGPYITHFRFEHFLPCGFKGYEWKPKDGAEESIYKKLSTIALATRATDHLDLPDLVEEDIWVSLPPKAYKTYKEVEDNLITQIEQGKIIAANAAVAAGKCRQIASGGIYLEVGEDALKRTSVQIHDAKTEALVDLVEELQGAPLLVAYAFHHDLDRIRKALGKNVPALNGNTSSKEAAYLIAAWNRGELPILCGHPASMGHGLNLQGSGSHIAWYSLTWDFEQVDQTVRRVYRQGQKNRVIVHKILARHTVDEVICQALASKKRGQDAIFEALKKMRGVRK
jgi:SNF2 family DNA or RNA helicase